MGLKYDDFKIHLDNIIDENISSVDDWVDEKHREFVSLLELKYGKNYNHKDLTNLSTHLMNSCKDEWKVKICNNIYLYRNSIFKNNQMRCGEIIYLLLNKSKELPTCKICGNSVSFISIEKGYSTYCSIKCSRADKDLDDKRKETCIKKYGVSHQSKSLEIKQKKVKAYIEHYGVDNPLKCAEIKEKVAETCCEKYGFSTALKNEMVKEKIKNTTIEKYGVNNVSKSDVIQKKKVETNLRKYGVKWPSESTEWKSKMNKIMYERLFNSDRFKEKCIPMFDLETYTGIAYGIKYEFKCNKCGNLFFDNICNGHIPRCQTCYPSQNSSLPEYDLLEFCQSSGLNVIHSDRTILENKELDVYIPSKNLAIEFNGLYWHSELAGKKFPNYHLDKTLGCLKNNIQLIHIFEDEWLNKQEIVESIINAKIGIFDRKIFARKCKVEEIQSDIAKKFIDLNHIQGQINAKLNVGLFYDDELVSVLSLSKSRYDKKYEWEILRFCSSLNTQVVGGLSRMLTYFKRKHNPQSIISYADRRFGEGRSYLNCSFEYSHSSKPSYYYVQDFFRYSRLCFQKHLLENKLESYDANLTEWQNMQLNGYDRIWDCGANVYIWRNKCA